MTYSKNRFQLTHLLQRAWYKLGQLKTYVATGGSATTAINTNWAGVEEQIFDDDDPALIYGSLVVMEDAGLAGADPEGRIGMITDYDSSTQTLTMDTVTTAVAANDRIGIASPQFPYQDMVELANIAIEKLGKIDLPDTSIVTVAGQTEYALPFRLYPKQVNINTVNDSNDHRWKPVFGWKVIPATAGSAWTLILPTWLQGWTLQIIYEDFHPRLNSYEDDIIETIAPDLAVSALVAEAFQWYNNSINGSNAYFLQRENKALQDLEQSKIKNPIVRLPYQVKGLPHWGRDSGYAPLTSDQRYP